MDVLAFWQDLDKPNTLIYLLAHKDRVTREGGWAAFNKDSKWDELRKKTSEDDNAPSKVHDPDNVRRNTRIAVQRFDASDFPDAEDVAPLPQPFRVLVLVVEPRRRSSFT